MPASGEPGILIMAHLDTVHPVGTLEKLPFRREGGRCYGPGILDMKGGTFAALQAIAALARGRRDDAAAGPCAAHLRRGNRQPRHARADRRRGEAPQIHAGARARPSRQRRDHRPLCHRALQPHRDRPRQPCRRARSKEGRSAIREMAKQILAIEAMTTEDCTFSVGVVHGGQWVNCVSTECRAEAL